MTTGDFGHDLVLLPRLREDLRPVVHRPPSPTASTVDHLESARLPLRVKRKVKSIDTGYEAPAVYAWARQTGFAQVAPVKRLAGFNWSSPVSGPTYVDATERGKRLRRGARLWTVAVSTFKAESYRYLWLDQPTDEEREAGAAAPPGTIHLPAWTDSEWCKQLVGEQLMTVRSRRGSSRLEWQKLPERNEALDCRVYARAAAWIAGADRTSDVGWLELERRVNDHEKGATQGSSRPRARRRHLGRVEGAPAGRTPDNLLQRSPLPETPELITRWGRSPRPRRGPSPLSLANLIKRS